MLLREAAAGAARAGREPASTLLRLADLSAAYGQVPILHHLTLQLAAGEVLTVLGRNGVGKTTLVNALFNFGPRLTGDIFIKGQRVTGWPTHKIARLGIALVPQGRGAFPDLSVSENLRLATLRARPALATAWTLERIFDSFPMLAKRRRSSGSTLSGGERQLLALARALLTQADILVLDEPTEGLAPLTIEEVVVNNIRRLTADGVTILLIEQNVAMALGIATRAVVLGRGVVVYDGSPPALLADADLLREYLGV